jgi:acylphosphatase
MTDVKSRKCVRLRISGRVHGVGFRDWTQRTATRLCLDGWVRNRSDGTVEAVLAGPAPVIDDMVARCQTGPRMARVDAVRVEDEIEAPQSGFSVLPTL